MNQDIKYIQHRIDWLKENSKELKEVYKNTKLDIINELSIEILCLVKQIELKLNKIERGFKKR